MLPLSKITTSSTFVLGSIGLLLFLIPYSFSESSFAETIFKRGISSLENFSLSLLNQEDKESIKEKLLPLLNKFESGLTSVNSSVRTEYEKVKGLLSQVAASEESLKKSYEENSSNFKKLEEEMQKLHKLQQTGLGMSFYSETLKNATSSLESLKSHLEKTGTSLQTIVCVLENSSEDKQKEMGNTCLDSENLKNQFKNFAKNGTTPPSRNKRSTNTGGEGGAVQNRKQREKKPKKH